MSLLDYIEHGAETLVETAVRRIREFEPEGRPYWLAFSGGKDSVVVKWLADLSGVAYEAYYNVTMLDPPELVRFIKCEHPDVVFLKARTSLKKMFLEKRFPPTRYVNMGGRWCCAELKERTPDGHSLLTGIRWAESPKRSKRKMVERCTYNSSYYISPIIDWDDHQLWSVIRSNAIPYCSLYDEGWTRLGCLLCPLADRSTRLREMERWPHIRRKWYECFEALWATKEDWGRWKDVDQMFRWWMEEFVGTAVDEDQECFRFTDN